MRSLSKIGVLLFVLALALAACQPGTLPIEAPDAAPDAAPVAALTLPAPTGLLSSLDGALPLADVLVTLDFGADGTVSGSDGCNRFSTSYTQDGSSLTIDQPMASTMMACEEPVMNQAAAYSAALAATTGFLGSERQLVLRDGDQILATFVATTEAEGETGEAAAASAALAGTSWTLNTLGDAGCRLTYRSR